MIPKKIHYCWFGGGPKSKVVQRCMRTWGTVLSGYEIKEWNEGNSPFNTAYAQAARDRQQWSRLSNFVRLHALMTEGGVYLDTDVEVLKPLDSLLDNECFLGFQAERRFVDWVNSAVLGACGEHAFLRRCMEITFRAFEDGGKLIRGPTAATRALEEMGLERYGEQTVAGVRLCARECFYPYAWDESFRPDCVKAATYCVHHWEGSWVSGPVRLQQKISGLWRRR